MKKIRSIGWLLLLCLVFPSCMNSENKALLVGEWVGADWTIEGKPSNYDAKQVYFNFGKEGGYRSDFGGTKEKGTYIVRDDKLYTTPDEQLEIMVQIRKLNKDSLVIDMNRSGTSETLTLIRKQP